MTKIYLLRELAKKMPPVEYQEMLNRKPESAELQNILDSYKPTKVCQ